MVGMQLRSFNNLYFSLRSRHEVRAYLKHPVLGPRYRQSCKAVLAHLRNKAPADRVMGWTVDAIKLHESVSTFFLAACSACHKRGRSVCVDGEQQEDVAHATKSEETVLLLGELLLRLGVQFMNSKDPDLSTVETIGAKHAEDESWRRGMGINCAWEKLEGSKVLSVAAECMASRALPFVSLTMAKRWR